MPTAPFSVTTKKPMNYRKQILEVLFEAGHEGLSVHKIAIHVHNTSNTLFKPTSFDEVRRDVQLWLLRNSQSKTSPVTHCERRGYYRINMKSLETRQTLLNFDKQDISSNDIQPTDDNANQQPSLFDI